jgi:hypothetical protein
MTRFHSQRIGLAVALLALIVLFAVGASPVAAYQVVSHSGTPGPYSLVDSTANPGATCHYGPANSSGVAAIDFIRGRTPSVHPKGNRSQTVAWQVLVQRQSSAGAPWSTVAKSSFQKAVASPGPHGAAPFKPTNVLYSAPRDSSLVRALYRIRWYSTADNQTVVAGVTLWITHYLAVWTVGSTGFTFDEGSCWSSAD